MVRTNRCQKVTTAAALWAQAGSVVYGPGINAAAVLLSSEGDVPVERAAALMEALPGTPVSAGFVARGLVRLADRLQAAGFDKAMKDALRAEEVLCGDETPVNVIRKDRGPDGKEAEGAPHAVTIRTPDARLIWYAAMRSRSSASIAGLGVLDGWHGYLVRDDYAALEPVRCPARRGAAMLRALCRYRGYADTGRAGAGGRGALAWDIGIIRGLRGTRGAGRGIVTSQGGC